MLAELGRGGFGCVYRAWDPAVHREVAIKVLTGATEPGMLARFRTEAATTGILQHKNIITVHDYGEHESYPYLVMEMLQGRSLKDIIENGPPLALVDKSVILSQIGAGLQYAHQRNVIHRDVKPANVMVLPDGTVKVLDFGIARIVNDTRTRHTATGMLIGTVEYMAPEQIQGADADELTDIFSYGVLSYELLTGRKPFRAPQFAAVLHAIVNLEPQSIRAVAPECPQALESLVRMALAKQRTERYQCMRDLLLDLAPIEGRLRTTRADELANEGKQALSSGNLEGALRAALAGLDLEPTHSECRELRRQVQTQRDRAASEERMILALRKADLLLQQQDCDQAVEVLEEVHRLASREPFPEFCILVRSRLDQLRRQREAAPHLAQAGNAGHPGELAPSGGVNPKTPGLLPNPNAELENNDRREGTRTDESSEPALTASRMSAVSLSAELSARVQPGSGEHEAAGAAPGQRPRRMRRVVVKRGVTAVGLLACAVIGAWLLRTYSGPRNASGPKTVQPKTSSLEAMQRRPQPVSAKTAIAATPLQVGVDSKVPPQTQSSDEFPIVSVAFQPDEPDPLAMSARIISNLTAEQYKAGEHVIPLKPVKQPDPIFERNIPALKTTVQVEFTIWVDSKGRLGKVTLWSYREGGQPFQNMHYSTAYDLRAIAASGGRADLVRAALAAVQNWKFQPARKYFLGKADEFPVECGGTIIYKFSPRPSR